MHKRHATAMKGPPERFAARDFRRADSLLSTGAGGADWAGQLQQALHRAAPVSLLWSDHGRELTFWIRKENPSSELLRRVPD
jgi:hypothetical protein